MTKEQTISPKSPESFEDLTRSLAWVPGSVMVADPKGVVRYVNAGSLAALGYEQKDILGRELTSFWDQPEEITREIMTRLENEGSWQGEIRQERGSAKELVSLSVVSMENADESYIIKIGHPVSSGQREKDLQELMDATPYVISIFRLSDRKYVAVNENFCLRTGYAREEVLGQTVLDLGLYRNIADREDFKRVFERDGFVDDMEVQFVSRSGEIIDGVISARRINFQGDDCGITASVDISELRKTQRALKESELLYRSLMEAAPESIVLTRMSDGKVVHANTAFYQRTGWTPEETLGRTTTELNIYVDSKDREKFVSNLKRDGQVNAFQVLVRYRDGSTSFELWSARVIEIFGEKHLLVVTRDIGELTAARESLEESERNYRAILEATPNSVAISSLTDSTYVLVNEAFYRNTGYSVEETIGSHVEELNLFEDFAERDRFLEVFLANGRVDGMELRFRKKDGSTVSSLVSARPVTYGNEPCVLVITTNIETLKKAQQALSEREANYRTILETAPYTITITKRSDSTYVEANPACCRRVGYTREEMIGKTPVELGLYDDPKDREALVEAVRRDGQVIGMEVCFRARDGKMLESLLSASPITYQGEECLLFISVEITKQKKIQRALQDREETYRGILAAAPYSIMITRLSDSKYLEVNDSYCRRTGYSRDEVIGKTALELKVYKNDSDRQRMLEVLRRDGRVDSMEIEFRMKDGTLVENLFSTTPITYQGEACLLSMTVDMSKQKKAERALRRSEQKYRNVLINMEEGYWETDLKGNFTFVNEAESCIHRCSPEELIGKNNRDYTSPENAGMIFKVFKEIYRTGAPAMITEYEMIREDGTMAYIDSSASLLRDETGSPIGFYGIARDITEKKKAADELEKYRKHLEQMVQERTEALENAQKELVKREKLSILGQLTATVSHELRNPLGVIRSSSFYLQRKSDTGDEKINKHFKRIEEQVNLCDLIIADLLEYTRGRNVTLEQRHLIPWLETLVSQLEETEGLPIEKHFLKTMPPIPHDQEKMRRVCVNLLENAGHAVRAMSETQKKAGREYNPHISISAGLEKEKAIIEIRDNGVGMDEETCEHAFEPLFTTRARGTGIGLANVKKIVSEHNGEVTLYSEPGKGTRVTVILPGLTEKDKEIDQE